VVHDAVTILVPSIDTESEFGSVHQKRQTDALSLSDPARLPSRCAELAADDDIRDRQHRVELKSDAKIRPRARERPDLA
jgi:hypothetical protein